MQKGIYLFEEIADIYHIVIYVVRKGIGDV